MLQAQAAEGELASDYYVTLALWRAKMAAPSRSAMCSAGLVISKSMESLDASKLRYRPILSGGKFKF